LVAVRPNKALLKVSMAVFDADGRHVAVAVEVDIILVDRREAVIRLDAEECAIDLGWDRACYFEIENITFNARSSVDAVEDAVC